MSAAARLMEDVVADHMQQTLAAHRAWMEAQSEIAAEFEQRVAALCAWRIQAMSDADSRYRANHATGTSLLVRDLPQNVQLALEQRSRYCATCGESLGDGEGHAHFVQAG